MQSLLVKFRLHVSSERRGRREKKLPYGFRFALFHFIFSTSELCHIFLLTLSLPECLMEFCKVTLTFGSVDEILWCDHSNESFPYLHMALFVFQNFTKWSLEIWSQFAFGLHLAVKGLNFTQVNVFLLHFTYPSDFVSFYFGAL